MPKQLRALVAAAKGLFTQSKHESVSKTQRKAVPSDDDGTTASFPLFSSLPTELRLEVWRYAAELQPSPDTEAGVCVRRGCLMVEKHVEVSLSSRAPRSGLLGACRESRAVAHGIPAPVRPYDPARDVLFASAGRQEVFFCQFWHPLPWVGAVRHLAVPLGDDDRVEGMVFDLLWRLHSLETVIVICPASAVTGREIDLQPPDPPDAEIPGLGTAEDEDLAGADLPLLRRLTLGELRRLQIRANYSRVSLLGRWYPVNWTKSGREYIVDLEQGLNKRINMPRKEYPRAWDPARKKLKLKFEARYFVQSKSLQGERNSTCEEVAMAGVKPGRSPCPVANWTWRSIRS